MNYALPVTHEAITLFLVSLSLKSENARPLRPSSLHSTKWVLATKASRIARHQVSV